MPHRHQFKKSQRRQYLAFVSPAFLLIGASWLLNVSPARGLAFEWLPYWMGTGAVGTAMVVAAILGLLVAALGRRLNRRYEQWAFGVMIGTSSFAAFIFATAWIASFFLGIGAAPNSAWVSAVIYIVWAGVSWLVSGWEEPT